MKIIRPIIDIWLLVLAVVCFLWSIFCKFITAICITRNLISILHLIRCPTSTPSFIVKISPISLIFTETFLFSIWFCHSFFSVFWPAFLFNFDRGIWFDEFRISQEERNALDYINIFWKSAPTSVYLCNDLCGR